MGWPITRNCIFFHFFISTPLIYRNTENRRKVLIGIFFILAANFCLIHQLQKFVTLAECDYLISKWLPSFDRLIAPWWSLYSRGCQVGLETHVYQEKRTLCCKGSGKLEEKEKKSFNRQRRPKGGLWQKYTGDTSKSSWDLYVSNGTLLSLVQPFKR